MVALYHLSVSIGTTVADLFYDRHHEAAYFGTSGAATIVIGLIMLPSVRGSAATRRAATSDRGQDAPGVFGWFRSGV